MSRIVIEIPDGYDRLEGVVEVFSSSEKAVRLPYQYCPLDRVICPNDEISIKFEAVS